MSINDSINSQLQAHAYNMYENKLAGNTNAQQAVQENQVQNLEQALADNKLTATEYETLKENFVNDGGSAAEFDQAMRDNFGTTLSAANQGSSDSVITLEIDDSASGVKISHPDNENRQIQTAVFNIFSSESIENFSKDTSINSAIAESLGESGNNIVNLQRTLNSKLPEDSQLKLDGKFGDDTMRALKNVFKEAVLSNDKETINQLIDIMEAVNNKVNPPWESPIDEELNILTKVGGEAISDPNIKVTVEDIKILPNE